MPFLAILAGVNPLRRATRWLINRFPRTFMAIGSVGFAGFVLWDIFRVWDSPIRGSTAWAEGTLVGLTFGVTAAVGWFVAVGRPDPCQDFVWWQWASGGLLVFAVVTTHEHGSLQPSVTNGYIVGALWYEIAALLGAAVTLGTVIGRQMVRRRRIHRYRPVDDAVRRPGRRSKSDARPAQAWRDRPGPAFTDPDPHVNGQSAQPREKRRSGRSSTL
jgi:hypothetical protein